MKSCIGIFIGLLLSVSVSAESLLEGRVRLESGQPVADAQVQLFDLTDLRQGAIARAMTDGTGYFALPLTALAGRALPARFALGPNYPNPFNPSTIIPYQLAASSQVRLEVFNLLGQRIATLVDGARAAGVHTAQWDATDAAGRAVAAGVYIYRMTVGMERQTGRMVLVDGQAGLASGGSASVMPGVSGVGGANGEGAQEYGLVVSGRGLVPYVDSAFRVESGMAPVELVVSEGPHSAGKVGDFDDFFDFFNNQQEEEDETEEEAAETDSTSSEGGPDLIVQSPSVSVAMLTPGQAFTLNVTVHNQGDEQAAATMLHYYRSNNSTITASDTEVGTDAIDALDASATSAASIALTAPTGGGSGVYYGACVASVSGESNTDNNCSSAVRITVGGQETTVATTTSQAWKLYWTEWDTESIRRSNLDGSSVEDLVITGLDAPGGLALDVAGGKMYWTDWDTDKIQRSNLDGSSVEDLITGLTSPYAIALDVAGGKMYWTDGVADKIQRSNLDGSGVEDLITGLDAPGGLALDVAGGKMYWTDGGDTDKIQRSNLDGSGVEDLVTSGLDEPEGLALDVAGGKMYWADDRARAKIQRSNLDGSGVEDLVTTGFREPRSLALDVAGGKMYWTHSRAKISRSNLDGSGVEDLVTRLAWPLGIALGFVPIDVEAGTDLAVEASVRDTRLTPGQSFTLSVTVRNRGSEQAAATTLRYYRSDDATISAQDTRVGTDPVGALAASGSSEESISLTAPSSEGTYYYGACVESVSGESNTDNNCSSAVTVIVDQASEPDSGGDDDGDGDSGGDDGGDAMTILSVYCEGTSTTIGATVTVEGTIRANRDVKNVRGWLTIDGQAISGGFPAVPDPFGGGYWGGHSFGDFSAGQTKSYRITESFLGGVSGRCGVTFWFEDE